MEAGERLLLVKAASKRREILVSAYACEPHRGSEPGVGWNWALHLAAYHNVTVLTRANNRAVIEKYLAQWPQSNISFLYYDLPPIFVRWKQRAKHARVYYYLWQLGAYYFVKKFLRGKRIDLIHHVTFAKYWSPSFLALLPKPFVLGPVGGGESAPSSFWWSCGARGLVFELGRVIARQLGEWDPFVRLMLRRARVAFAATPETAVRLRRLGARHVQLISQVALPAQELAHTPQALPPRNQPLVLVSVGQLRHLKGLHLALRALASLRDYAFEYRIIGDGPERARLEKITHDLKLQDRVTFCGALPRAEVLQEFQHADILLHPALHESGGWVVAEAMNAGCVVVAAALGGSSVLLAPQAGVLIAAREPQQFATECARALEEFMVAPARLRAFAECARAHVRSTCSWQQKTDTVAECYEAILAEMV